MKTLSFLLIIGFIVTVCALAADAPAKNGKLRHVVAFKFKDTATKQQIKEVEDAFRALKGKIPEIVSYDRVLIFHIACLRRWGVRNAVVHAGVYTQTLSRAQHQPNPFGGK